MSKVEIGRDKNHKPIVIEYDDAYSFKDFTGRDLSDHKMDNLVIYASCFSQETPGIAIFPKGMTGTSFYHCNLDNASIPLGNQAINCSQRQFKVQADLRDWEIDEKAQPIKVINEEIYKDQGISVDPKDIPVPVKGIVDQAIDWMTGLFS